MFLQLVNDFLVDVLLDLTDPHSRQAKNLSDLFEGHAAAGRSDQRTILRGIALHPVATDCLGTWNPVTHVCCEARIAGDDLIAFVFHRIILYTPVSKFSSMRRTAEMLS